MEKEKIIPYVFLILIIAIPAVFAFFAFSGKQSPKTQTDKIIEDMAVNMPSSDKINKNMNLDPSTHQLDKNKKYFALIKTDLGNIKVELSAKETPITVNNFVYLAKEHFYDGVIFHRTIPGFMIQGGDPTGTGTGGPGYKFNDEPFTGNYSRGTMAMANAGPNTNGSQFFIMHEDTDLPKNYVIFGKVIEGIETVDKIAQAPTKPQGEGSSPVNPVKMNTVEIIEE